MKAKKGYKRDKSNSPFIGNWLKRYFMLRTAKKFGNKVIKEQQEMDRDIAKIIHDNYWDLL